MLTELQLRDREADRIAQDIGRIATPDSRFDLDITRFIPGFPGSAEAAQRLADLQSYHDAGTVFCTLEASLWEVRQTCLASGKDIIVPTYGLARGVFRLRARDIAPEQRAFATCLDGLELFGEPVTSEDRFDEPEPLFLCGASAVTRQGVRFGMGAGYIDVEWWIARSLGLVDHGTEVAVIVHDCQCSPLVFAVAPDQLACDHILTPASSSATNNGSKPIRRPALDFDPSLTSRPLVRKAFELD